jgi:hypothetical protein
MYGARRMVSNALSEAARRDRHQQILVDAQFGQALGGAHDALNSVEPELRALLGNPALPPAVTSAAEEALESIATLAQLLRRSAPARDALSDETGFVPLVGISAAQQHKQGPRAVSPLYGALDGLPRFMPWELRAAARQVGLVLDETRLLHTADVERSVLLFTIISRAVLVPLSPLLGDWTSVRQPLASGLHTTDLPWAAASATSIATALVGPLVVRRAMEHSIAARRFRNRLLLIEVPVGAAAIVFSPSWTVVVFASGVTNWWQRQNEDMAFSWGKLPIYVGAVVALQGFGLARQHVSLRTSAFEIFGALTAILTTGASYGAMLPLTVGTALDVLVGDGRRSLRAVIMARSELLRTARQLNEAAEAIGAATPDSKATQAAAITTRHAALQLQRAADRAGRRGLMASQVLPDLAAEAIRRSFLHRRDTPELERQRELARETGKAAPSYATEPIFLSADLLAARIAQQQHARILLVIVEHSLNEARIHGTGAVRIILSLDDTKFEMRIGNRPARGDTPGILGQGGAELRRLARQLPAGVVEQGLRPADEVHMPAEGDWWVVRLTCSASILDSSSTR